MKMTEDSESKKIASLKEQLEALMEKRRKLDKKRQALLKKLNERKYSVHVKFTTEEYDALRVIAKENKTTPGTYVRKLVLMYIETTPNAPEEKTSPAPAAPLPPETDMVQEVKE